MKKLTLVLSMMIALVGLNANAAMYLVGSEPLGQGWDPSKGIEMTDNGDGTYTYDVVIDGDVWFCFAEALTPGNSNEDWSVFNGQYRYGPTGGVDQTVTATEWTTTQKQGNGNGSYKFHGSGDKYTVTFDLTNLKFKIDGYVEPVVYESFTVAGNNADIFGAAWNVTLTENDMTLDETDGLYKLVKENVEITNAPYTLYYKVAANHAWGESWGNPEGPDGNQDYVFPENGTYDLTFKFNFDTKEVSLDAVLKQAGPAIDPLTGHLYIVGNVNGNGWNPANAIEMETLGDDDTFTITNAEITAATDNEFGFFSFMAIRGTENNYPADGYRIGAPEDGTIPVLDQFVDMGGFGSTGAFKLEPGFYNMTVVLSSGENGQIKVTKVNAPEPVIDDVYIIGDVNDLGWAADKGVKMTYDETNAVYTANITTQNQGDLGVAYFGFTKMLADSANGWDDIAAYRFGPVSEDAFVMTEELLNVNCDLATDGSYNSIAIPAGTWTVTVDLVNNKFAINGTWPTDTVVPEPTADVYIIGDVNDLGWAADKGVKMTYDETNAVYTANITTQNQGDLGVAYFGFTKMLADSANGWDDIAAYRFGPESEDAFVMTKELLGTNCALATDGSYNSIAIPAGTWTVTVDLVNNTFAIAGEWPTVEHYDGDVYILGEVNDNGGWFTNVGVKMTRDAENNVYTATITTAGENIPEGEEVGYSYFSFTKQLADSAADWNAIAPYRFGAVSEGDFLVTEELLGETLALENGGDSYKIPAGNWNLTLSVDNMTLVITKVEAIRGDVNNDKNVTIADVTALIDYLLSGSSEGVNTDAANCNLDEGITIADVTSLIDYLLSGNW